MGTYEFKSLLRVCLLDQKVVTRQHCSRYTTQLNLPNTNGSLLNWGLVEDGCSQCHLTNRYVISSIMQYLSYEIEHEFELENMLKEDNEVTPNQFLFLSEYEYSIVKVVYVLRCVGKMYGTEVFGLQVW